MSNSTPKTNSDGRNSERGGAAVEFALVLPLFMALVMGALDYGYFFFSDQVVTNSAREGARAGTLVNPGGSSPTTAAQSAATAAAKKAAEDYMKQNGVSCPSTTPDCVTATYTTTPGVPAIDVLIKYEMKSLTGFTSIILPKNIQAHALMRWQ